MCTGTQALVPAKPVKQDTTAREMTFGTHVRMALTLILRTPGFAKTALVTIIGPSPNQKVVHGV